MPKVIRATSEEIDEAVTKALAEAKEQQTAEELKAEIIRLRKVLNGISQCAERGQGQWVHVPRGTAPQWTVWYKVIIEEVEEALKSWVGLIP